ncbi:hypothetical protein MYX82_10650 [Acidobacteria bacterium AH-259-D05]|nr:hypothetical protein [Acidobacteria bacterium AH-259-D05]
MNLKAHSPYLNDPKRLADVIAAIQAAATYKFYKLDFGGWADRISGDESEADHWRLYDLGSTAIRAARRGYH